MSRLATRWLILLLSALAYLPCALAEEAPEQEDVGGGDEQCSAGAGGAGCQGPDVPANRPAKSASVAVSAAELEKMLGPWSAGDRESAAKLLAPMWRTLNEKKEDAKRAAKSELGNRDELFEWLSQARQLNALMIGLGLNYTDRRQVVEQMAQVLLRHFSWTQLFGLPMSDLAADLVAVQPLLSEPELLKDCCDTLYCCSLQVKLILALNHVGTDEAVRVADTHLEALRGALPASGHCLGNTWADRTRILIPQAVSDEKSNLVEIPSLTRQLASRGGSASLPSFWPSEQVPVARLLEEHSAELLAELEPLCGGLTKKQKKDVFRQENLASDIAKTKKDWYSLNLYHTGHWHEDNCAKYAPKTCALLRKSLELYGYIKPPGNPTERLVLTYVRFYRLRAGAHLFPHFGKPWVMNTHLGVHIPSGTHIRVWNETATWEKGKVLSFLDGAEHEVRHTGSEDRFVLSVVAWTPEIVKLREKSPSIANLFSIN